MFHLIPRILLFGEPCINLLLNHPVKIFYFYRVGDIEKISAGRKVEGGVFWQIVSTLSQETLLSF